MNNETIANAVELGWINGYKWGVEYPTNGKKPDLPDDLKIHIKLGDLNEHFANEWLTYTDMTIGNREWSGDIESFRIVDERYKPKEPAIRIYKSLIIDCNPKIDTGSFSIDGEGFDFSNSSAHLQLQQALSKGKPTAEELSSAQTRTGKGLHSEVSITNEADLWYINKELPPVGVDVEFMYKEDKAWVGRTCMIIAVYGSQFWALLDGNRHSNLYELNKFDFRPIKTEREKFIEAAMKQAMAAYQSGDLCSLLSDDDFEHYFGQLFDSGEFFYKPKE